MPVARLIGDGSIYVIDGKIHLQVQVRLELVANASYITKNCYELCCYRHDQTLLKMPLSAIRSIFNISFGGT